MQEILSSEEVRNRHLSRVMRFNASMETLDCPLCRRPLSVDLGGKPFCRHCQSATKLRAHQYDRRFWGAV